MAHIAAFRGVRYNPAKVGDLQRVTAPPYDVISTEQLKDLRGRSPYNVVHIDLPNAVPATEGNPYTEAGLRFRRWLDEGILQPESQPAIYLYKQRYRVPGTGVVRELTGFIAAVRLARWEEGVILPHEHTFAKPKEDRLRLMRAGKAHFSQVYSFYSDPELKAERALEGAVEGREPDIAVHDDDGAEHRVWVVTDPEVLEQVIDAMKDRQLYIADGHHRYETSVDYRDEMRAEHGGEDPTAGWEYSMMMTVNADGGGLTVLPTHRMVRLSGEIDRAAIRRRLEEHFRVEEMPLSEVREAVAQATEAIAAYPSASVLCWPDVMWAVIPKDPAALGELIEGDASPAWKSLSVTVLHRIILERAIGMDRQTQDDGEHIVYTKDPVEALERLRQGEFSLVCIPNAPSTDVIRQVADAGEAMPHKSTYFYPKLLTGLVLADLTLPVWPGASLDRP